jgi:two-component system, chemotaxis family, protein-glutamate methylesterase/glutaminase
MSNRDLIAIGTSAGGIDALLKLVAQLKPNIPAAILVTIHLSAQFRSELDCVLSRAGRLPAHFAAQGERYRHGTIYLAPPDRHLLLEGERLYLGSGARENNVRPAIDPMLRSVGVCCGPRAVGVVLTGTLDDGASGLWAIDQCGGLTVVQDPQDAAFADMPLNALDTVKPDHLVALGDLPGLLEKLVREPAGRPVPVPESIAFEVKIAKGGNGTMDEMDRWGRRSLLACPECHGIMWETEEGDLLRYRCHVGHSYTADVMTVALDENLRKAMGSAVRALEERVSLTSKLQQDAERRQHRLVATNWAQRAQEARRELDVIRDAMQRMERIRDRELNEQVGNPVVPEAQPAK